MFAVFLKKNKSEIQKKNNFYCCILKLKFLASKIYLFSLVWGFPTLSLTPFARHLYVYDLLCDWITSTYCITWHLSFIRPIWLIPTATVTTYFSLALHLEIFLFNFACKAFKNNNIKPWTKAHSFRINLYITTFDSKKEKKMKLETWRKIKNSVGFEVFTHPFFPPFFIYLFIFQTSHQHQL